MKLSFLAKMRKQLQKQMKYISSQKYAPKTLFTENYFQFRRSETLHLGWKRKLNPQN